MGTSRNGALIPVAPAVHTIDKHTDVTRDIFLPAAEAYINVGTKTAVGAASCVSGVADGNEPVLAFDLKVPSDFVSFSSVKAKWLCGAAAGDMDWKINAKYAAAGQLYTAHEESQDYGVTATGGTSIFNVQEPADALSLASLVKDDNLGLYFLRWGANPLDTLDLTVYIFGLLFTYVAER